MKPLPYILLLALCGCVVSKPEIGNLKPEQVSSLPSPISPYSFVTGNSASHASSVTLPPPPPVPIVMAGPELPCTNCWVMLQETASLAPTASGQPDWQTHQDYIYHVTIDATNHYAEAGLTNALGFFRWKQVQTNQWP